MRIHSIGKLSGAVHLFVGCAALMVCARSGASDWPQWHGPNRDAVSTETGFKTGDIKEAWSADIGVGFSAVSVAGGRVYTMGNVSDEDAVWCFDEKSGKLLWAHKYPCAAGSHKGPRVTPTVDGDSVYTLSREGHLFCLGASDGKVKWDIDITKKLDARQTRHSWGFSCSPLVRNNQLILDVGPLAALDKKTGKKIWSTGNAEAGFSSPRLMKAGTREYVLGFNADGLLIADADGGKKIAEHEWKTEYLVNSATPIPSGDKIFISSGYNRGCALLRLQNQKLKVEYENKVMRNHCNSSVLYKGHLFGFDGQQGSMGSIKCLEFDSGEVKWESPRFKIGSLMIADGKIIALLDGGDLLIAEANTAGFKELSRTKVLDGKCWTYPVLANGRIYCRNNEAGKLVCLNAGG